MIKPGSLVRLNPTFFSITFAGNPRKDYVGIVIRSEKEFYRAATVSHSPQDRHYILWGNETYSYEPTRALVEVISSDD